MKRCPFCGLPMEEDEEYCQECGTPADWNPNDDEDVTAPNYYVDDDEDLWQKYRPEEEEDIEEEDEEY